MRSHATLLVVLAFALTSCGGAAGDDAKRPRTTVSGVATPKVHEVTVHVDGRTLSGHCRGTKADLPAVMLEVGVAADADQNQLATIERHLEKRTVVCAYDRAGVGKSDPPTKVPRPMGEVLADADAFIAATKIEPPHFLVGFSAGGAIAFMYAQAHPDTVNGFVSINPVPPAKQFLPQAKSVETKDEYQSELGFYDGSENEEGINFHSTGQMLTDPLPPTMPYAVMFDEDCGGDTQFCRRILPPLTRVTRSLASVGEGGGFVRAPSGGHNLEQTRPQLVHKTIDDLIDEAAGG